jgi:hypothetical protein
MPPTRDGWRQSSAPNRIPAAEQQYVLEVRSRLLMPSVVSYGHGGKCRVAHCIGELAAETRARRPDSVHSGN